MFPLTLELISNFSDANLQLFTAEAFYNMVHATIAICDWSPDSIAAQVTSNSMAEYLSANDLPDQPDSIDNWREFKNVQTANFSAMQRELASRRIPSNLSMEVRGLVARGAFRN